MPYYLFKVFPDKKLQTITQFDKFREAKDHAQTLRAQLTTADNYNVKVIFAKTELEAEVLLKETREYRPLGDD